MHEVNFLLSMSDHSETNRSSHSSEEERFLESESLRVQTGFDRPHSPLALQGGTLGIGGLMRSLERGDSIGDPVLAGVLEHQRRERLKPSPSSTRDEVERGNVPPRTENSQEGGNLNQRMDSVENTLTRLAQAMDQLVQIHRNEPVQGVRSPGSRGETAFDSPSVLLDWEEGNPLSPTQEPRRGFKEEEHDSDDESRGPVSQMRDGRDPNRSVETLLGRTVMGLEQLTELHAVQLAQTGRGGFSNFPKLADDKDIYVWTNMFVQRVRRERCGEPWLALLDVLEGEHYVFANQAYTEGKDWEEAIEELRQKYDHLNKLDVFLELTEAKWSTGTVKEFFNKLTSAKDRLCMRGFTVVQDIKPLFLKGLGRENLQTLQRMHKRVFMWELDDIVSEAARLLPEKGKVQSPSKRPSEAKKKSTERRRSINSSSSGQSQPSSGGRRCFKCNSPHHIQRDCPSRSSEVNAVDLDERVIVNGQWCHVVVDTGAVSSMLPVNLVEDMGELVREERGLRYADGRAGKTIGVLKNAKISLRDQTVQDDILVVPQGHRALLGRSTLSQIEPFRSYFDPERETIAVEAVNAVEWEEQVMSGDVEEVKDTFVEVERVLLASEGDPIQLAEVEPFKVHLKEGHNGPISLRPRRIPYAWEEEVHDTIKRMEESGMIKRSNSQWGFPLVLLRKKNGALRFCVDYVQLNDATMSDGYGIPNIEECVNWVANNSVFSTFDCYKGYYAIPLEERTREMTAFVVPWGRFEWLGMPFGLKNAPAHYQRVMDEVLGDLPRRRVARYFDNILVGGRTMKELREYSRIVKERLAEKRITLNREKCLEEVEEIEFLGFLLKDGALRPPLSKREQIRE